MGSDAPDPPSSGPVGASGAGVTARGHGVPPPLPPLAGAIGYGAPAELFAGHLHPLTILVSAARALQALLPAIAIVLVLRAFGRPVDTFELVLAALGVLRVVGAVINYATYRYWVDGTALHIRSGVVTLQRRAIPLDRIQNINLKRDWVQQLLKLVEVQVETGSGSGAEATLSSLSAEQAETLRRRLLRLAQDGAAPAGAGTGLAEPAVAPPAQVVYAASVGQLLLAGATRNQAGAVLGAIAAVAWTFKDAIDIDNYLWNWLYARLPHGSAAWVAGVVAIAALLLVGWAVSMARSVLTYFGFRLEVDPVTGRLRRVYGLFTRRESVFPAHRLQMLRVEAPLLQRKLRLCRVLAETAGSFAEKEDAATSELCPIVRRDRVGEACGRILPGLDLERVGWRKVSPKFVRRATARYGMAYLFVVGVAAAAYRVPGVLWLVAGVPVVFWVAVLQFRALRYALTDSLLLVRKGVWKRVIAVVPRDKVQHAAVASAPLQRRLGLATLSVSVAGSVFGGGVRILDVPADDAARLLDALATRPAR